MKARAIGLGIGILLIVAAFAVVLWQGMNLSSTGVALAQGGTTSTPTAAATTTPSAGLTTAVPPTTPSSGQQQQQQQTIGDTFWGILAGKLNVNAEDLKARALEARKEMLDQAVKDGRITQAQADALKAQLTSNGLIAPIRLPGPGQNVNPQNPQNPNGGNNGPFHGFGNENDNRAPGVSPGFGFGRGLGANLQELDAVAKALKLDTKTLIQDLSQGQTLAAIAKTQSVDEATVKQAIIDARTAQIDQLLSYGLISQVQADQMKAQLTPANIDLTRTYFGSFRDLKGAPNSSGFFSGMGQWFGQMFENDQAPAPNSSQNQGQSN